MGSRRLSCRPGTHSDQDLSVSRSLRLYSRLLQPLHCFPGIFYGASRQTHSLWSIPSFPSCIPVTTDSHHSTKSAAASAETPFRKEIVWSMTVPLTALARFSRNGPAPECRGIVRSGFRWLLTSIDSGDLRIFFSQMADQRIPAKAQRLSPWISDRISEKRSASRGGRMSQRHRKPERRFAGILELDHFLEESGDAVSGTVIDQDNLFTKRCFAGRAQDFVGWCFSL